MTTSVIRTRPVRLPEAFGVNQWVDNIEYARVCVTATITGLRVTLEVDGRIHATGRLDRNGAIEVLRDVAALSRGAR